MKKLLVVDDSKTVLDMIRIRIAKNHKFNAYYATSFHEAAELLSIHDFFGAICDLVLSDAPNGEVVDLCTHEGIPTIAMTASLNDAVREKIVGRPILDYVYKNSKEDIVSVVNMMELLLYMEGQKVLIIDDSKLSRKNIHRTFSQLLFQTIEATDSASGFERLKEHPDVKVIVVDYTLQGMKGDEIVQTIRNQYPDINAVIFGVTSNNSERIRYSFLKKGATDYFTLPLIKEEITAKTFTAVRMLQKVEEFEKQASIIDNNIMTINIDLEGYIKNISQAYLNRTGFSREELIDKHIFQNCFLEDKNQCESIFAKLAKEGRYTGEIKSLTKNGMIFYEDISIERVLDRDNKVIEYYGISHDITDKKRIEELSITDGMTNIYNRRYFDIVMSREIDRALRAEKSLGLIILDIDFFKAYNDYYGHIAGDNVIIQVGKLLQQFSKRASDYAFRLGGEEFAILVWNMSDDEIEELAQMVRRSLEEIRILHEKSEVSKYVTASFGIANIKVTSQTMLEEIYSLADKRLYTAKHSGKNCVSFQ